MIHSFDRSITTTFFPLSWCQIIDNALSQLTAVAGILVQGLNDALQVIDVRHALRAGVVQSKLKGIAGSVRRDGSHELDELICVNEGKRPAEEVNAAASALP